MSVVYFASHKLRPRQIKIGYTEQIEKRARVGVFEIIATIPGSSAREAALHRAHRHYRIDGEWFAASAVLATLSDLDHGDLSWLDAEPSREPGAGQRLLDEADAEFGGRAAAAFALGYSSAASLTGCARSSWLPPGFWGRMAIYRIERDGRLPRHLIAPARLVEAA